VSSIIYIDLVYALNCLGKRESTPLPQREVTWPPECPGLEPITVLVLQHDRYDSTMRPVFLESSLKRFFAPYIYSHVVSWWWVHGTGTGLNYPFDNCRVTFFKSIAKCQVLKRSRGRTTVIGWVSLQPIRLRAVTNDTSESPSPRRRFVCMGRASRNVDGTRSAPEATAAAEMQCRCCHASTGTRCDRMDEQWRESLSDEHQIYHTPWPWFTRWLTSHVITNRSIFLTCHSQATRSLLACVLLAMVSGHHANL
jgi:hypothetical protein